MQIIFYAFFSEKILLEISYLIHFVLFFCYIRNQFVKQTLMKRYYTALKKKRCIWIILQVPYGMEITFATLGELP